MTGLLNLTVRAATYTVEVEPSLIDGSPLYQLSDQLGGDAGYLDTARPHRIIGAPAWWTEQETQAVIEQLLDAHHRQCRRQPVPPMQAHSTGEPIPYRLTRAGRSALAIDLELQARMDTTALDEIASLLRDASSADPGRVLALIGEQVAATRRTIRAAAQTG